MGFTLVTGAAHGIGAAICRKLAGEGHNVLVHYCSSKEAADTLVQECRDLGVEAQGLWGDFSTEAGVADFLSQHCASLQDVRHLVNNVGPIITAGVTETSWVEWQKLFELNLFAPMALIQGVLESIIQARGAIVNLGVAGVEHYYPDKGTSAYFAAKEALWAATRSLARELAPRGVRVNMVSPGYVGTTSVAPPPSMQLPMERMGTPQEIAEAVAFFLSELNGYVTGQNIDVAGGVRLSASVMKVSRDQ